MLYNSHFEELPKHIKVWSSVTLYTIFVNLTVRTVEVAENLRSAILQPEHKNKNNMVETLKASQKLANDGSRDSVNYGPKKIQRM